VFLDYYFIPIYNDFMNSHFTHEVLIYGYDSNNKNFNCLLFINDVFTTIVLSQESLTNAYSSRLINLNSARNENIYLYSVNYQYRFEASTKEYFFALKDYFNSVNPAKRLEIEPYQNQHKMSYGMQTYDNFINLYKYMFENNVPDLDHRPVHILFEHKKVIFQLIKHLSKELNNSDELNNQASKVFEISNISRNIILKYKINHNDKIPERFFDLINLIIEEEEKLSAILFIS